MSKLQSINPHTGEVMKEFNYMSDSELEKKVSLANDMFQKWRFLSFGERAGYMKKLGDVLKKNCDKYAKIMTSEMGKPITQAKCEVETCSKFAHYYAQNAEKFLQDQPVQTEAGRQAFVAQEPLGVIFQVAPFNYPFLQCYRFLTAAIMAGNTILIRHGHSVTMSALAIEETFKEAGFPDGVCQIVLITKEQVSKCIADFRTRGVTVTGSVGAGRAIAKQSGEHIKKTVMELGGCDPYIICNDADLDFAVKMSVWGRVGNNGECCAAMKRALVVDKLYNEFCEKISKEMQSIKVGNPMEEDTYLGPLARSDLRDQVHKGVQEALKGGAKLLCGGKMPEGKGFYYPPTVLADVTEDNFAFKEEIFGPVLAIVKIKDEEEGVRMANNNQFGLGGGFFTKDVDKALKLGRKLECGMVYINRTATTQPEYPFGGMKNSGYGRECGEPGIKEWVNYKSYVIGPPPKDQCHGFVQSK